MKKLHVSFSNYSLPVRKAYQKPKIYPDLVFDSDGNLFRDTSYFIDRVTKPGETVYLMPFFVRILNGLASKADSNTFAKKYWNRHRLYLERYDAVFIGISSCNRFAVLKMVEGGKVIQVQPSFFSKRFSSEERFHLNERLQHALNTMY